jgi:hypothetical protein
MAGHAIKIDCVEVDIATLDIAALAEQTVTAQVDNTVLASVL